MKTRKFGISSNVMPMKVDSDRPCVTISSMIFSDWISQMTPVRMAAMIVVPTSSWRMI